MSLLERRLTPVQFKKWSSDGRRNQFILAGRAILGLCPQRAKAGCTQVAPGIRRPLWHRLSGISPNSESTHSSRMPLWFPSPTSLNSQCRHQNSTTAPHLRKHFSSQMSFTLFDSHCLWDMWVLGTPRYRSGNQGPQWALPLSHEVPL